MEVYRFMVELTEKQCAEFKAICKKEGITYNTEDEYRKAAREIYSFVSLTYDMAVEHLSWERRLKDEPDGFWIDSEGRTCYVCYRSVNGQIWFDKWGLKCDNRRKYS